MLSFFTWQPGGEYGAQKHKLYHGITFRLYPQFLGGLKLSPTFHHSPSVQPWIPFHQAIKLTSVLINILLELKSRETNSSFEVIHTEIGMADKSIAYILENRTQFIQISLFIRVGIMSVLFLTGLYSA